MIIEENDVASADADVGGGITELTAEAAASRLMELEPDEPESSTEGQPAMQAEQAEVATTEEVETVADEGAEATTEDAGQPEQTLEESAFDWEKVPGTAKFRLRDGTTVTAADLKRDYDDLRQARDLKQRYEAQSAEFQQTQTRVAQEAERLAKVAPIAIQAIQASLPVIPPMPDRQLQETDFVAYQTQVTDHIRAKAEHSEKVEQMRAIQAEARNAQVKAQREQEAQVTKQLQEAHKQLLEEMPFLQDQTKRAEFQSELLAFGQQNGFDAAEMETIGDPRIVKLLHKAMQWDKLQKNPPKPASVQGKAQATPAKTAAPGPRTGNGDAAALTRQNAMQRARQSGGDPNVIADLIAKLDL